MNRVSIIVTITAMNIAIIMNKREDRKMDNIILFESKDGYCYGVYNLETQTLLDCEGKEINGMNDVCLVDILIWDGINNISKYVLTGVARMGLILLAYQILTIQL